MLSVVKYEHVVLWPLTFLVPFSKIPFLQYQHTVFPHLLVAEWHLLVAHYSVRTRPFFWHLLVTPQLSFYNSPDGGCFRGTVVIVYSSEIDTANESQTPAPW